MLALGAQHDRANLRCPVEAFQHIGDLADHVGVDEVVGSTPHFDRCDDARLRDANMLVACHVRFPALLFRRIALHASLRGGRDGGNGHGTARSRRRFDPL
jgi:hypothetical protein